MMVHVHVYVNCHTNKNIYLKNKYILVWSAMFAPANTKALVWIRKGYFMFRDTHKIHAENIVHLNNKLIIVTLKPTHFLPIKKPIKSFG